jgi:hypothetical protein
MLDGLLTSLQHRDRNAALQTDQPPQPGSASRANLSASTWPWSEKSFDDRSRLFKA